jgi:hypothetical protein
MDSRRVLDTQAHATKASLRADRRTSGVCSTALVTGAPSEYGGNVGLGCLLLDGRASVFAIVNIFCESLKQRAIGREYVDSVERNG